MVGMAQGGRGARLRAAVDRMHAAQLAQLAQLAALAVPAVPASGGPQDARGASGLPAAPQSEAPATPAALETVAPEAAEGMPAGGRDVYGAERQLLAQVAEMGTLLVRLGRLAPADVEAVEVRRRLVTLAVACGNTLAELVTLAFEVA